MKVDEGAGLVGYMVKYFKDGGGTLIQWEWLNCIMFAS